MKKEEVPQDAAIFEHWHEITYALDDQGRYVLTPSLGWDASNLANLQAECEAVANERTRKTLDGFSAYPVM